jgi:hypothetical protein
VDRPGKPVDPAPRRPTRDSRAKPADGAPSGARLAGLGVVMRGWIAVGMMAATAASAAPVQLTHQGRLLDGTGGPTTGPATIEVAIWRSATSTNAAADRIYTETFSSHPLDGGYYSVVLGTANNLDSAQLSGAMWVETTVNGSTLNPRVRLTSVPTAANAGVDLSVFNGVKRDCGGGGTQSYNSTTGWTACPTIGTQTNPATSCQQLKNAPYNFSDGAYWIDRDGTGPREGFQAWCEMDVAAGGWMLLVHILNTSSGTNFMNLALPDCSDDQTACIERNAVLAGEMNEILIFDRINQNRWVTTTRATSGVSSNLIDLVSTGNNWGTNGNTTFTFNDGVSRTAHSHHVNDGFMIDTNPWNNCSYDSNSNVGTLCIACIRSDNHCGGQGKDSLFYVR